MNGPLAAVVLCAFLAYRPAFHGLPLHMDTAFYVPNAAVAGRSWGVFRGWNTYFSGGSRLLPQLAHTLCYRVLGPTGYAHGYRWMYAVLVAFAATISAFLAVELGAKTTLGAVAAFTVYLVLASETQYGAYFESAEVFQAPVQAGAVLCCALGIDKGSAAFVLTGIALLWADAVLIKLTGAIAAAAVSTAVAAVWPSLLMDVALVGGAAVVVYILLLRASGGGVRERWAFLARHERYVRRNYRSVILLSLVKVGFFARLILRNPPVFLLAAFSLVAIARARPLLGDVEWVVLAYAAAIVLAFFRQGHRVWYYIIPFFPLVAVACALGIEHVARFASPSVAEGILVAVCGVSIAVNLIPALRLDAAAFTHWVFSVYNRPGTRLGDKMAAGDVALMKTSGILRQRIAGRPMLILGAFNQASVLTGAAYDTPLASVCALSAATAGDLARFLPNIEHEPPQFVLDTEAVFDSYRDRLPWLRRYHPILTDDQIVLFALEG